MAMWKGLVLVAFLMATLAINGCYRAGSSAEKPWETEQFFLGEMRPLGMNETKPRMVLVLAYPVDASLVSSPYYVTLYDTVRHSPVYSAYRLLPGEAKRLSKTPFDTNGPWKWRTCRVEPSGKSTEVYNVGKGFTRGPLNPELMHDYNDLNARISTFTYCNVVPLWANFGDFAWLDFQWKLRDYAVECGKDNGTLYVVTGPWYQREGPLMISNPNHDWFQTVPDRMWTGGCCWRRLSGTESLGVIGMNTNESADALVNDFGIHNLEQLLGVNLFPGDENRDCLRKAAKLPKAPKP